MGARCAALPLVIARACGMGGVANRGRERLKAPIARSSCLGQHSPSWRHWLGHTTSTAAGDQIKELKGQAR